MPIIETDKPNEYINEDEICKEPISNNLKNIIGNVLEIIRIGIDNMEDSDEKQICKRKYNIILRKHSKIQ
jgi:hypothetical protein